MTTTASGQWHEVAIPLPSPRPEGGLFESLRDASGPTVAEFITSYVDSDDDTVRLLATATRFNIESIPAAVSAVVNLKTINNVGFINKFFEAVNDRLAQHGMFVGCVETKDQRRQRIHDKLPRLIFYPYYFLDFVVKRVLPKWKPTMRLYFLLTRGQNRVLSLAETLGRLVSCGFKILDHEDIDNLTYFVAQKTGTPSFDMEPTYGPLCRLTRVGQHGKAIKVYKLRTMHPYAEYLQDYIFKHHRLKAGGKFNEDFRITAWGKVCRKWWIDELPMLINWLRADVKLVGVRPLSRQYLSLYPEDVRKLRLRNKPGLVPPFYADLPSTFDEIIESERHYLLAYQRHPIRTDFRYFARAAWNILFKNARSG